MALLTFAGLRGINRVRCEESFHNIMEWSPTDWACAFAGEAGEVCNAVKKLRRLTGPTKESGRANTPTDANSIIEQIGGELADAVIYADLLAQRLGLSLDAEIIKKFNIVSDRVGSKYKILLKGGD